VTEHDPGRPNRYERAAEDLRRSDRVTARGYAGPLGAFLLKQLAWGVVGALLGLLFGSWTLVVVNFVVFAGVGLVARAWVHRRRGPRLGQ
jgi:Flp pilus assembly protein TadB